MLSSLGRPGLSNCSPSDGLRWTGGGKIYRMIQERPGHEALIVGMTHLKLWLVLE